MSKLYYPPANITIQDFPYPGSLMETNCCVLHTTEGFSWPSYGGGATAPNITGHPFIKAKKLGWRQHYPANRSARALQNDAGGVETNTLGVFQVELVGTCNPANKNWWSGYKAGRDYIYWPDADDWALEEVGDMLAWLEREWQNFKLEDGAPRGWPAYPGSYGEGNPARMSFAEWRNCYEVVGHMHVPENSHGDPGDIDIKKLLAFAGGAEPEKDDLDMDKKQFHNWVRSSPVYLQYGKDGSKLEEVTLSAAFRHVEQEQDTIKKLLRHIGKAVGVNEKLIKDVPDSRQITDIVGDAVDTINLNEKAFAEALVPYLPKEVTQDMLEDALKTVLREGTQQK